MASLREKLKSMKRKKPAKVKKGKVITAIQKIDPKAPRYSNEGKIAVGKKARSAMIDSVNERINK